MKVSEMLKNVIKENVQYLILDSSPNSAHGDVDFEWYYYNTLRYNKMKPNDLFIYRRPAKSSKNRKFYFYGGGVIDYIEEIDDSGNVRARIKHAFKLVTPITQGETKLDSFVWKFKTRIAGSYERFFSQYGMNLITQYDFENLFGDLECVPFQMLSTSNESNVEEEEEQPIIPASLNRAFSISVVNDPFTDVPKGKKSTRPKPVTVKKTDFSAQQEENVKTGKFGEVLILHYEIEYLIRNNRPDLAEQVEHTSELHGDGTWDIKSFEIDGSTKYIEVKTTRKNTIDGFFITSNEIKISTETDNYYIYRLYNLNEQEGTADLYIYPGPCNDGKFKLTPTAFRVSLK